MKPILALALAAVTVFLMTLWLHPGPGLAWRDATACTAVILFFGALAFWLNASNRKMRAKMTKAQLEAFDADSAQLNTEW